MFITVFYITIMIYVVFYGYPFQLLENPVQYNVLDGTTYGGGGDVLINDLNVQIDSSITFKYILILFKLVF